MIISFLLALVTYILAGFFLIMPSASLIDIPVIGQFLSDTLTSIVLMWNAFKVTFPYAVDLSYAFFFFIVPFEIAIIVVRLILGSRTPVHH